MVRESRVSEKEMVGSAFCNCHSSMVNSAHNLLKGVHTQVNFESRINQSNLGGEVVNRQSSPLLFFLEKRSILHFIYG